MQFIFHFISTPLQIVGLCCFLYWPWTMHVLHSSFCFYFSSDLRKYFFFSMGSATGKKAHFAFDSMLMYHLLLYLWPFYSPLHSLFLFVFFLAFQISMFPNVSSFNNGDLRRSFYMQVKWWMFVAVLVSIRFEYEKRKSEHWTLRANKLLWKSLNYYRCR